MQINTTPRLIILPTRSDNLEVVKSKLFKYYQDLLNNLKISQSKNPELTWVNTDDSPLGIQEVRSLINELSYSVSILRTVIIQNIDKSSVEAQNALLKTLEEPPNKTLFLITARQVSSVLPTIRSRCIEIYLQDDLNDQINKSTDHKTYELLEKITQSNYGEGLQLVESVQEREEAISLISNWLSHVLSTESNPSKRVKLLSKFRETQHFLESGVNVKLTMGNLAIQLSHLPK